MGSYWEPSEEEIEAIVESLYKDYRDKYHGPIKKNEMPFIVHWVIAQFAGQELRLRDLELKVLALGDALESAQKNTKKGASNGSKRRK